MQTNEEYTKKQGLYCPCCDSYNLGTGDVTIEEGGEVHAEVSCYDCGVEYKEVYKLTGYHEVERNIVNCLHVRNMHTACHELWICEDDTALPVLAKSLKEGVVPFDEGIDSSTEVDYRTQREDGTFIVDGRTYQPTNKEVLDV